MGVCVVIVICVNMVCEFSIIFYEFCNCECVVDIGSGCFGGFIYVFRCVMCVVF